MSKDEVLEVKSYCLQSFYNFSHDQLCRELLVAGGALPTIMKLCSDRFEDIEISRYNSQKHIFKS